MAKIHQSGDISLVTPWYVITEDLTISFEDEGSTRNTSTKGSLAIPIKETNGDIMKLFIPCAGLDPDTDQVPTWVTGYNIRKIIPEMDKMSLYPRVSGNGKLSGIKAMDYASLPSCLFIHI